MTPPTTHGTAAITPSANASCSSAQCRADNWKIMGTERTGPCNPLALRESCWMIGNALTCPEA